MADVHSKKETRSYNMSKIKGKNTKPGNARKCKFLLLMDFAIVFMIKITGKPDIVLPKYKTVIFVLVVSGMDTRVQILCSSKTRTEWWLNKINHNIENDKKSNIALQNEGWKIIIIWECQLKKQR